MRGTAKLVVVGVVVGVSAGAVFACKTNSISANTNNETDAIGAAGGSLTGADGEKLIVPPGALSATTVFDLSVAQPGAGSYPQSPPSGYTFAGDVFEYQPHGTQFATPATIVIPYTSQVTSPVLLQAEEGATSWTMVAVTGTTTVDVSNVTESALEGAVTTLSYFVVADSASGDGGTTSGCSGRSPVSGAPMGTVSSFMGSFVDNASGQTIDLSNIVDGYVTPSTGSSGAWIFTFTQYSGACGYVQNDDFKIGTEDLLLGITGVGSLAVQTYGANEVGAVGGGVPADAGVGPCGFNGGTFASSSSGMGITIDAVDSSHVQGSFSFTPQEGTAISGTFDLPICTKGAVTPSCCLQ